MDGSGRQTEPALDLGASGSVTLEPSLDHFE
jgi:hypothetical protein